MGDACHQVHSRNVHTGHPTQRSERRSTMDHVLRASLARELHARPFLGIGGSVALAHFAIYANGDSSIHEEPLRSLCQLTGLDFPVDGTTHHSARWNDEKQVKCARHTALY